MRIKNLSCILLIFDFGCATCLFPMTLLQKVDYFVNIKFGLRDITFPLMASQLPMMFLSPPCVYFTDFDLKKFGSVLKLVASNIQS